MIYNCWGKIFFLEMSSKGSPGERESGFLALAARGLSRVGVNCEMSIKSYEIKLLASIVFLLKVVEGISCP